MARTVWIVEEADRGLMEDLRKSLELLRKLDPVPRLQNLFEWVNTGASRYTNILNNRLGGNPYAGEVKPVMERRDISLPQPVANIFAELKQRETAKIISESPNHELPTMNAYSSYAAPVPEAVSNIFARMNGEAVPASPVAEAPAVLTEKAPVDRAKPHLVEDLFNEMNESADDSYDPRTGEGAPRHMSGRHLGSVSMGEGFADAGMKTAIGDGPVLVELNDYGYKGKKFGMHPDTVQDVPLTDAKRNTAKPLESKTSDKMLTEVPELRDNILLNGKENSGGVPVINGRRSNHYLPIEEAHNMAKPIENTPKKRNVNYSETANVNSWRSQNNQVDGFPGNKKMLTEAATEDEEAPAIPVFMAKYANSGTYQVYKGA